MQTATTGLRPQPEHGSRGDLLAVVYPVGDGRVIRAPIAWVEATGEIDVTIRCPHCGEHHHHGLVEGTRVAHCHAPQPETGPFGPQYYIRQQGEHRALLGWGEYRAMETAQ